LVINIVFIITWLVVFANLEDSLLHFFGRLTVLWRATIRLYPNTHTREKIRVRLFHYLSSLQQAKLFPRQCHCKTKVNVFIVFFSRRMDTILSGSFP
jgi:hypothetical protein